MGFTTAERKEQKEVVERLHAENQRDQEIWKRYGQPFSVVVGTLLGLIILALIVLEIMGKAS